MVSKIFSGLVVVAFSLRVVADVGAWGQCGGNGWTGETVCVAGYICTVSNEWYSQCLPGTATTSAATTTSRTATTLRSTTTTSRTTTAVSSSTTTRSTTLSTTTTTRTITSSTTSTSPTPSNVIFVSPSGSDSGSGSITSPILSIQSAVNLATPGYTIYLRGGTYALTKNVNFAKSGTASQPYTVAAYQGEKVILDGEALTGTPAPLDGALANADRGIFHIQNANYWRFIDLEFINGPYGVYNRDASNNYFERLITRDNYESGFQLEGASANNQVLYLDSYGNRDPRKNGESADGFAVKSGSGAGNILRGGRIWNNVDDGIDLWEFASPVTIEDTIVWGNGYNRWGFSSFQGDGNGFKLGGGASGAVPSANHIVRNCISFLNAVDGFIDNGNAGSFTMTRNTAFNNGRYGYRFQSSTSTFTSNIAASNRGSAQNAFSGTQTQSDNSWNVGGTWNNGTFKSVSASTALAARQANGKIQGSDFLLPTSGAAIGATTYW